MVDPFVEGDINMYVNELSDLNNKIGFIGAKKVFSKAQRYYDK